MSDASIEDIALFPLNTVLFPGGLLPLRIFEQRYMDMATACLKDNLPFGICLIKAVTRLVHLLHLNLLAVPPESLNGTCTSWDSCLLERGVNSVFESDRRM
jgi:Lon protease-like protein